jgi:hypothetical protein
VTFPADAGAQARPLVRSIRECAAKKTRNEHLALLHGRMFVSKAIAALKALLSTTETPLQQAPLQQPSHLHDPNAFTYYIPSTPPTPRRSERLSPKPLQQQPLQQQPLQQPPQSHEPRFFPYDCPSTPTPPRQSEKERLAEQLARARESKLKKKSDEKQLSDLETRFWEGTADDVDMDSKEELYVMAMKRLDCNWSFKDVTDASGIAYNTLKPHQDLWKKLGEKDFRFHVKTTKRGRKLFEASSLPKMQQLNKDIIKNEDAQLVSGQRSSYNNVIRPILIQEAEAAGVQSVRDHSAFLALTLTQEKMHSLF